MSLFTIIGYGLLVCSLVCFSFAAGVLWTVHSRIEKRFSDLADSMKEDPRLYWAARLSHSKDGATLNVGECAALIEALKTPLKK